MYAKLRSTLESLCQRVLHLGVLSLLLIYPSIVSSQVLPSYQATQLPSQELQGRLDEAKNLGITQPDLAAELLREVGEAGTASAWIELALLQLRQPEPDFTVIIEAFERGLALGAPQGATGLGNLYLRGHGVPIDIERAGVYFKQAVDAGDLNATQPLGDMYRVGLGLPADPVRALVMYMEGGTVDNASQVKYLAAVHALAGDELTVPAVPPDTPVIGFPIFPVREWFSGFNYSTEANALVGSLLIYGIGTPVDEDLGVQFLAKAAREGSPIAQMNYGLALARGVGVEADAEEAKLWLQRGLDATPLETKQERVTATYARLALNRLND